MDDSLLGGFDDDFEFSTLAVHFDKGFEKGLPDIAPPMHVTTTFQVPNDDHLVYSRAQHTTRRRLESLLGRLEGGDFFATTYSSGLASVSAAVIHIKPKKIFIAKREGYFGSQDVMNLHKHFLECYFEDEPEKVFELVDLDLLDQFIEQHQQESEQRENNKAQSEEKVGFKNGRVSPYLIWLETPKNPSCTMEDISLYVEKAKKIGAAVLVDSTFGTPVLQKPLLLGADFVLHSATKYMSGHSDILAGVLVVKDELTHKKLQKERSVIGNTLGNMETWLLLRSIRTMEIRVNQQSRTAQLLAEWLESQIDNSETNKRVTKVWYPTLQSNPKDVEICKKQMGGRGPGILSVELDTPENAEKLPTLVKVFTNATSLGGYESLMDYRYQWDKTVAPTLVRLSIGLEHIDDLIKDMKRALLNM